MNVLLNKQLDDMPESSSAATQGMSPLHRSLWQLDSLMLIRQLYPLIIAVQQHRGATLALLGGNTGFQNKQLALQAEIEQRIAALEIINNRYQKPLSDSTLAKIADEWAAVIHNCQYDHAVEIFELHCFFIEQLMELIWQLTVRADYFSIVGTDPQSPGVSGNGLDDRLLVQVILRDFPQLVEMVARIRGLAAHTAATRHCDAEYRERLTFWLRSVHHHKEALQIAIGQLNQRVLSNIPSLLTTQLQEHKLVQLMNMTHDEIISRDVVSPDSQRIFDFATGIIEMYSKVIEQGILYVRTAVEDALSSSPANHQQ